MNEITDSLKASVRAIENLAAVLADDDLRRSLAALAVVNSDETGDDAAAIHRWRSRIASLLDDLNRRERALRRPWFELREELATQWVNLDSRTRTSWLRSLELAWHRQRQGQAAVYDAIAVLSVIRNKVLALESVVRGLPGDESAE